MRLPEIMRRFRTPSLDECRLLMAKAGLPEIEGDKFFHHFESNGWVVGKARVPMRSLNSAVNTWRINFEEQKQKPQSIWELKTIADELRKKADRLVSAHSYESPHGLVWKDQEKRTEHRLILSKISELQNQIIQKA